MIPIVYQFLILWIAGLFCVCLVTVGIYVLLEENFIWDDDGIRRRR